MYIFTQSDANLCFAMLPISDYSANGVGERNISIHSTVCMYMRGDLNIGSRKTEKADFDFQCKAVLGQRQRGL